MARPDRHAWAGREGLRRGLRPGARRFRCGGEMMIRTSAAFLGRTLRFVADLARRFSALLIGVAGALYSSLENWLTGAKHARYGLAIARFLLGVMFVGTALTNLPTAMYTFGAGSAWTGQQAAPTS